MRPARSACRGHMLLRLDEDIRPHGMLSSGRMSSVFSGQEPKPAASLIFIMPAAGDDPEFVSDDIIYEAVFPVYPSAPSGPVSERFRLANSL